MDLQVLLQGKLNLFKNEALSKFQYKQSTSSRDLSLFSSCLGLIQNYRTLRLSQSPTETGQHKTKDQKDCKLHDCRNTDPRYNGDEDPEPEKTIRQKKQGDINCMEETGERMGCVRNYRTPRPQPKPHETAAPQGRSQIRLGIHIM